MSEQLHDDADEYRVSAIEPLEAATVVTAINTNCRLSPPIAERSLVLREISVRDGPGTSESGGQAPMTLLKYIRKHF